MVTLLAQAVKHRRDEGMRTDSARIPCYTPAGAQKPAPERKAHSTQGGESVSHTEQSARQTFILLWDAGPAWTPGKTSREQAWWDEHAAFMDRLFAQGMILLGGPFADTSGALVIVEAASEQEVADVFARDPFVINGIFALRALKEWHIFLDARRGAHTS